MNDCIISSRKVAAASDRPRTYCRLTGKVHAEAKSLYQDAYGVVVPPDLEVCHSCDNPPCVNIAHLYTDTKAGNQRRKAVLGRGAGGGAPTLTAEQIEQIRTIAQPLSYFALLFGVTKGAIQYHRKAAGVRYDRWSRQLVSV